MMSLAKHFFAKLRAFPRNNTWLNHALAMVWCACFLPVAWSGAAKMCCLLLLLARDDCLLLAGLLLLVQLQSLSFSSWTSCWTLVLLLLAWSWASIGLHGFAGLYCVMMCKNWCCSWYGVQGLWCSCLVQCWMCECGFPWCYPSGRLLTLLAAVVLPAASLSQMTELLVSS
jgi:hypothetical protein